MKIAIFGCGLIGKKRGLQLGGHEIVGVYDPNRDRADALAAELKTKSFDSEDALLKTSGAEISIIATPNAQLAPTALKAIEAGMHVLIEKPAGISVAQIQEMIDASAAKKSRSEGGFQPSVSPRFAQNSHFS